MARGVGLRIGCGTDVHPLAPGRRLVLGGVEIRHERGLTGHSDADVLAHAICDALLGALGRPDMGVLFPDTDEAHRGRSSLQFLRQVMGEARSAGYAIVNLDAVVLAEAPRLQPHIDGMRAALAAALGCPPSAIGLKAKRCEGLGALGRREGILAQAVVLLGPASGGGAPIRRRPTAPRRRRG
jgi:2-C-methyl-D-erythritol 2,4-cyclodiphosphate synthase